MLGTILPLRMLGLGVAHSELGLIRRRNLSDTRKEYGSSSSCRGPLPDCYDRADTRVNEFAAIAIGLINFTMQTFPCYFEVFYNDEFHAHTRVLCDLHLSSSLGCSAVVTAIFPTLFDKVG